MIRVAEGRVIIRMDSERATPEAAEVEVDACLRLLRRDLMEQLVGAAPPVEKPLDPIQEAGLKAFAPLHDEPLDEPEKGADE